MSFKVATGNPLWRRSAIIASAFSIFLPAPRAKILSRILLPYAKRHSSEVKTYFQNGSSNPRLLSDGQGNGSSTGPIFVLPSENQPNSTWSSKSFFWGFITGTLLTGVFAVLVSIKDEEQQNSVLSQLSTSKSSQDGNQTSPYAMNDGTELQRGARRGSGDLPPPEVLAMEKNIVLQKLWNQREIAQKDEQIRTMVELLNASNTAELKVHKALVDAIIDPQCESAILDNALLESRPLILSDHSRLDPSKASLVRVVDSEGKNRILILGVDMDWHESIRSPASPFPSDCFGLDTWLTELAWDLDKEGANAGSLAIYLYANRVIMDLNLLTGMLWTVRFRPSDFPAGFPLAQMRRIQKTSQTGTSISDLASSDANVVGVKDQDRKAS